MREKARVGERLFYDAFAEGGDGFGDGADTLFVFGGEEKRAEERAVDAIAEDEALGAHARVQFIAEGGSEFHIRAGEGRARLRPGVGCACGDCEAGAGPFMQLSLRRFSLRGLR